MILATVRTCPQRWHHYQRLRRNYAALHLPWPLRTFETSEYLSAPQINSVLTARAAIRYCERRLPKAGWMLFLEDDVQLRPELAGALPLLLELATAESVDCFNLCNRKTPVQRQFAWQNWIINELAYPVQGSHALLLPQRHLSTIYDAPWKSPVDGTLSRTLAQVGARVWQIVKPVLVEHVGKYSTFAPHKQRTLEVNHAIAPNLD